MCSLYLACYRPRMRNSAINFFMYIGMGVVIGLVVGLVVGMMDDSVHPAVTGMIVGALTGIAVVFAPRATNL